MGSGVRDGMDSGSRNTDGTGAGGFVDRDEVARFDALAATWWDEAGPMRVLHRFNPVRLGYIRDTSAAISAGTRRRPFPSTR